MNKYKIVALDYKARALLLCTGGGGSISHALATVPRNEATALVEAMPEGKIAERLIALADYIEEIDGTLSEPIITFVSGTKTDEDVQMRFTDDILAIIRVASPAKLEKVLRYFADTYLDLKGEKEDPDIERTVVSQQESQRVGVIKVERDDEKKKVTITVHPTTYAEFEGRTKNEIASQAEEQIDPDERLLDERLLIDHIKFIILEKIIYALFHSIETNERLADAKQRLGMVLSERLDPSLITQQDLAANPEEGRDLAEAKRRESETAGQVKEVRERTKLAAKAKDATAAWLAEHPELAAEFEETDRVDKELEEGEEGMEGFHEEEEGMPADEEEEIRTDTSREPAKKPEKGKPKKGGLDFED